MINKILTESNTYIVDSLMGNGKTTTMMNTIPMLLGQRFIYIVEYLSEVDRVKKELSKHNIKVKSPEQKGRKVKSDTIKELLSKGVNIVTTHALLDKLDKVTLEIIKSQQYVIVMDEVHKIIEQYPITKKDWQLLVNQHLVEVDTEVNIGQIKWLDMDYKGKFDDFKNLALLGNIFFYSDDIYIWTFPIELFTSAKSLFILTYLFEGSLMKSYFDYFKVSYEKVYMNNGIIKKWKQEYQDNDIQEIRDKIHIYEGHLNFDKGVFNMSSSYFYKVDKNEVRVIKNNMLNYFKHIIKGKSHDNMWTTLKSMKHKLKGKGYTKGFVSLNMRATNEYKHKKNLCYAYNRYLNPIEKKFFEQRGITVNEDLYAVSELLQWLFRSQIREGKDINVYIPNHRMRTLLKDFLKLRDN